MPTVRDVMDFMLDAEARMLLFYARDRGMRDIYQIKVEELGDAVKLENGRTIPKDTDELGPKAANAFEKLKEIFVQKVKPAKQ